MMAGHDSHSGMAGGGHAGGEADHLQLGKIDSIVATDFLNWPRHQSRESLGSPRLVALLYGMVCVDIGGREVLLPNPDGIPGVGAHVARIWFKTSTVADASKVPERAKGSDEKGAFTYFDIANASIVFKAFKGDKELKDPTTPLKKRNNPYHPWIDFKWVRCLKKLTGMPLIRDAQRNDRALVRARIWLGTGTVAPFPPFSHDGQHNVWRARTYKRTYVLSATTDAMIWSRPLSKDTTKVRMTITPLGERYGYDVWLAPESGAVLCAATHATLQHEHESTKLTHSKAYARLLKNGDPARFPVPELEGVPRSPAKHSSEDVHCECASCP